VERKPGELRSLREAQRWFRDRGLSVSGWAVEQGFNPTLVYTVLQGRRKCLRGQSFRIALALKLIRPPEDD
jgi:gp16 family phage-associated protein